MQNRAFLQGLNEAQQMAVLHGEGPALVAAGPGSGKTTVIACRLLYLIQERRIPPQNILVITFTREAAKSMQSRFQSQLQSFNMCQSASTGFVSFGTFHSFFYQIIRSVKKYSQYQLITQQEKIRIIKPILKEIYQENVTEAVVNGLLTQISFFKNTGQFCKVQGAVSMPEGSMAGEEEVPQLQKLFEGYEAAKTSCKRLDFDDMLYLCRKVLLEDPKLLKYWQNRFTYLLIDEFQDINPIQYEILGLLAAPPYNLFAVGDDDQAIYGFRGSDSRIFQSFQQDFKSLRQIYLTINYRCGEAVVKASRRLIEQNKMRVAKELVPCEKNASKGKISLIGAVNTKESYSRVAEGIKEKTPEELHGEAVLFRTNSAMQMFAAELAGRQIPFIMGERCESIYDHFLVKDIMDYFQAAKGCLDRSLFLRLFQKQRVYLAREALRTEQVDLAQVKVFYSSGFYESRQAVAAIEALERHLLRLANMCPKLGISYILHAMDYKGYLQRRAGGIKETWEEWQELLEWLMQDAAAFSSIEHWQAHQEIYGKELAKECQMNQKEKKGIHLLTLHASKGLEFEKVYIMNLNEGIIPKYRHGEVLTREQIEEERRLCYVGMTRAREILELHYLTGTKENPRLKSRFLEEMENI